MIRKYLILYGTLAWPFLAGAHEVNLTHQEVIVEDLRAVASQLRHAHKRLDSTLSTDPNVLQSRVTMAQAAFYKGDYERSAQYLMDALSRPGLKRGNQQAEILTWLGESFLKLGFRKAAATSFARAVEQPKQGRSALTHRLRRLYEVTDKNTSVKALQGGWNQYLRRVTKRNAEFSRMRYLFGRAMYRVGKYGESERVFGNLSPQDPQFVRGQYFLGVIHLRRGEIVMARTRFDAAFKAWVALDEALRSKGPAKRLTEPASTKRITRIPVDESSPGLAQHGMLGASIRLTLGRLAAHHKKFEEAWRHYRHVPKGSVDAKLALAESIYVLGELKEYRWAARALSALASPEAYSVSSLRAALDRARFLAKGQRYADSEAAFGQVEKSVNQIRKDSAESPATQAKIALLNQYKKWEAIAPSPKRMKAALDTARDVHKQLSRLSTGKTPLPLVAESERLTERLKMRLKHIHEHIRRLPQDDKANPVKGLSRTRLTESLLRLKRRLTPLQQKTAVYAKRYQGLLRRVLAAERKKLTVLGGEAIRQSKALAAYTAQLPARSKARLDQLDARAVLGQVNIAYWKKEAVSEQIMDLLKKEKQEKESLDPEGHIDALSAGEQASTQPKQPRASKATIVSQAPGTRLTQ